MFAVERKVIQQMTADIEEAAYAEDFIDEIIFYNKYTKRNWFNNNSCFK